MKKTMIIFWLLVWSIFSFAQTVNGDKDYIQHSTFKTRTDSLFQYRDTLIPVLDISYHEFSTDSAVWTKDFAGAQWVRFSNDVKNTWWILPISAFNNYWTLSGDTITASYPNVTVDSLYVSDKIDAPFYYMSGDTLAVTRIHNGGDGVDGYVLTYSGDTAIFAPLGSGYGETNLMDNVGERGIGVYDSKIDSTFNMRTIASLTDLLTVALSASDSVVDLDLALKNIVAGVALGGGGSMESDVTLNVYIPELIEVTSVDKDNDQLIVYDFDGTTHNKINPIYFSPTIEVDGVVDVNNADTLDFIGGTNVTITGDGDGGLTFSAEGQTVDLLTDSVLRKTAMDSLNLIGGDQIDISYSSNGNVTITSTATGQAISLLTDSVVRVSDMDTLNLVAGDNITIGYSGNGDVTITAASGLPTCSEGEFLAWVGGQWTCVNVCDYICADTIIDIINTYNDTVGTQILPGGDVNINFARADCLDSVQITADQFVKNTTNLQIIKIVIAPDVGELHYGGVTVSNGDSLLVTQGVFNDTLYYVSDVDVGSYYTATFDYSTKFKSNTDFVDEFQVFVGTAACVTDAICYGYLYNWYTVDDSRELTSSADWTAPTHAQFDSLISYAGGTSVAGGKLKEEGVVRWLSPNVGAVDSFGFSAIGSGRRGVGGAFTELTTDGDMWSSTEYPFAPFDGGYRINITNANTSANTPGGTKKYTGLATRLVKDATGLPDGTTTTYTGNDGKTYNAIVINELYWTTENLEETEYRNGDPIPNVTVDSVWANATYGALSLYNNDLSNACKTPLPTPVDTSTYGYVYNWWAAIGDTDGDDVSDKDIASSDSWEIPDYLDWQTLADIVDPDWTFSVDTIGRSLRSIGLTYWNDPSDSNLEGTDDVGFDGRGAGVRNHTDGSYAQQGTVLRMWRSEESASTSDGMLAYLQYNVVKLGVPFSATTGNSIDKNHGCSIRLVNNSTTLSDGEYGTYTGNDGKIYLTVCIGTQEWIVTNLVETKWRDGTSMDQVGWDGAGDTEWINATSAKMSIP